MKKLRTLALLVSLLLLARLPALADGAPYKMKVETIERIGPQYKISVAYPQLSGLAKALSDPFNEQAKRQAEQRARAFVAEIQEIRRDMDPEQRPIELSLLSKVETKHLSRPLVVLYFTGYEFRGGAHGEPIYQTLALDALDGRDLEIQDMFLPDTPWLATLSKSAIAQLDKRAKELSTTADWIREGAGPKAANFQVFWPGQDGLHLVFPNYTVAPYCGGAPEVVVPYKALQKMLNPRYFH